LQEIEELDASVAVIDRGRIVARGTRTELIERYGASALELTFEQAVPTVARVDGSTVRGPVVRIPTADPAVTAAQLLPHLGPSADELRSIEIVRPSLESVFLTLTGRQLDPTIDAVR
jgi:ABC-2 type transport system ATP-binding protein